MVIAHLTDIHVASEQDYAGPGGEAWLPKVAKHSEEMLVRVLEDLAARRPDHVILTGDLTLTSEVSQFERARAALDRSLGGLPLTVIPGNHDRWCGEAAGRLERTFGDLMRGDVGGPGFPFCRLAGDVAFVAIDSSPFVAGADPADVKGRVGDDQLRDLAALCADPRLAGRFPILLVHHHLRLSDEDAVSDDPKDPTPLEDAARVEAAIAASPIGMVLHGHRHRQMRLDLELGGRRVPVLCPGSATRIDPRPDRTARYGIYEVDGGGLRRARVRRWDPDLGDFAWGSFDGGGAAR
ncbi:MAG TPA: metallophosphoesterase [Vulgatibacter sp.]